MNTNTTFISFKNNFDFLDKPLNFFFLKVGYTHKLLKVNGLTRIKLGLKLELGLLKSNNNEFNFCLL